MRLLYRSLGAKCPLGLALAIDCRENIGAQENCVPMFHVKHLVVLG